MTGAVRCRSCDAILEHTFADLGCTPLANSYLRAEDLKGDEPTYPLHARVCHECYLVQISEEASPDELFGDYAYYSSYSTSWLEHSRQFATEAIARFDLNAESLVVEVASNDGYLLQYFQEAGVPVLGVEPARNVARDANAAGIPTEPEFFGTSYARDLVRRGALPDLIVGNNVLAHVPDINDFVEGLATLLKPTGTLVMEFPHLLNLIDQVQFDTIYHEHFSYLSLLAVEHILGAHGLAIVDVELLATHGGSLRVFAMRLAGPEQEPSERVRDLREVETNAGLHDLTTYAAFARKVESTKRQLREFLERASRAGKSVAAYGAAAKGNTLLNTIGVASNLVQYVVDRSPHKQGLFLPGSHLPVYPPDHIFETRPDYVLILPWNLTNEITAQMSGIRAWGGKFVVPIPETKVLP